MAVQRNDSTPIFPKSSTLSITSLRRTSYSSLPDFMNSPTFNVDPANRAKNMYRDFENYVTQSKNPTKFETL